MKLTLVFVVVALVVASAALGIALSRGSSESGGSPATSVVSQGKADIVREDGRVAQSGAGTEVDSKLPEEAGAVILPKTTSKPEVDLSRYVQLIPRDAIAPIYEPVFVAGSLSDLDPQEVVIGVEINGEAKAYPVGPLNYREMVNDVIGGVPVLVTW